MAKKKKKTDSNEDSEIEKEDNNTSDLEKEFEKEFEEDFEDELDLEEELDLLDTDDMDADVGEIEKIVDKDEEKKQLYLSTKGSLVGEDLYLFGTASGIVGYKKGIWFYPDRINWMLRPSSS